ncbi:MAG: BT_3928 family protein [Bacteroidota bacterium]
MKTLRTLFRNLVGVVFIFSGFVKGIDPLGTVYRMQDYFLAFGTGWANSLALPLTIFLCTLEFMVGISLLFNLWLRIMTWALLPLMTFFTILTFFDAVYNLVPDCGCFGDAIKLSNVETFIKNLVLMAFVIPVFLWRKKYKSALPASGELGALVLTAALFTGLSVYCLWHLPVIDFSDWRTGNTVSRRVDKPVRFYVTYKNRYTGETQEFLSPNYPWNDSTWMANWMFVSQRVDNSLQNEILLMIEDTAGNDLSETFLNIPDYNFFLVAYDLTATDRTAFEKLQPLADHASGAGYSFICLTSTLPSEIERFKSETGTRIDFYNADDVVLKSMIRSNPGLILLKDGKILAKWHYNDFPEWQWMKKRCIDK